MDFLQSFFEAHNALFTIPILFGLILVFIQVVGFNLDTLLGLGEADADVDADFDADVDVDVDVGVDVDADVDFDADVDVGVDADVGLDADADVGVDADADAGIDAHAGLEHGLFMDFLAFFNLGKVPFMSILLILFFTFGLTGVIVNFYVIEDLPFFEPWMKLGLTAPAALLAAVLVTKSISELMATYIPTVGPQAIRPKDLEGRIGEVVSVKVDDAYGRVLVQDFSGQRHMVHCLMMEGEPAVPKGGRVVLVAFDGQKNTYRCSAASPHAE